MSKHFFARDMKGRWQYRYKVFTQEQVEFYNKMYLEMKDMKHAVDFNAPPKWSECLFCDLYEQIEKTGDIDAAIRLKVKELNG